MDTIYTNHSITESEGDKDMNGSMKKGKALKGWSEAISDNRNIPYCPEGYSSAEQIAKKTGRSASNLLHVLCRLRESGKIDCMQARLESGKIGWVYKD